MLTDEEWRHAYEYLLRRLMELGETSSVVVELQEVPRLRLEDDLDLPQLRRRERSRRRSEIRELEPDLFGERLVGSPAPSDKMEAGERQDLDVARNRAPRPREAFFASFEVLVARLRECPALAERLQELFQRPAEGLRWLPDASEEEFATAQESFDASDFSLSEREKAEIEIALQRLETLLREE